MPAKTAAVDLSAPQPPAHEKPKHTLRLESGREIRVYPGKPDERIEISEPSGRVLIRVTMTEQGPVMIVEGARLELKAAEEISLEADRVTINARRKAVIQSQGELAIDAGQEMKINSTDEIRVTGKMIHLN